MYCIQLFVDKFTQFHEIQFPSKVRWVFNVLLCSFFVLISQKFDLTKVKVSDLDFEAPFSLTMQHDTDCHVSEMFNITFSLHNLITSFTPGYRGVF